MPLKPKLDEKSCWSAPPCEDSSNELAASPASPPEATSERAPTRLTDTPTCRAASGFSPVMRSLKPAVVRWSVHATSATPTGTSAKSHDRPSCPKNAGQRAELAMVGEIGCWCVDS